MITLTTIEADAWINDADADSERFRFNDTELDIAEFLAIRNPHWGDAPNADVLERNGIVGYLPRGAGNADTYMYVLGKDEYDDWAVALVDNATLTG